MSAEFNPYREWLSIPVNELPPNYYRLLGLALFESDVSVIEKAADRQMAFVRTFQTGQYSQQSQQILNELAQARVTLLDKRKKAVYDAKLRAEQKSGSNGGIGIVSSLGSYGEVQSAPPPSAASLTPQPWSNDPLGANPGVQNHVTPPGGITAVPPVPNPPNRTKLAFAFLKKHWMVILSAFVALQLIICGTGLLVNLLKPSKTEVAQNTLVEQPQNVDDENKDDSQPAEAAQLAKRYYEQSVDLQDKEDYDEALIRINVAVELQPDNELYKVQQKALTRLKSSLGKAKTQPASVDSEDKPEQNQTVPVPDNVDKPVSTQPDNKLQAADVKRPARTSLTPEEAEVRLEEARLAAEAEARLAYNESVAFQKQGKYIQAAEKLDEALKLYPDNEQYKKEKQALMRLIESLGKANTPQIPSLDEEQTEQSKAIPVNSSFDKNAGKRVVKVINGVEFAFRWCPPGTFMMGSPESEEGRIDNETQHQVTLTKGFWMMETEVTQKQWKAVMGTNPSYFKDDDLPVEQVSWNDSQEFCNNCTKLGLPVQLPTEAQWEYACRAGSTTAYFWGNALNGDKANIDGNYPCGTKNKGIYLKKTTPVGSYDANAWGLYDMHGNVWEWCQDWRADSPSVSVTDPTGPSTGSRRDTRGGGWDDDARNCRSACRVCVKPDGRLNILGFRCVSLADLESSKTGDGKSTNVNNDNETTVSVNTNFDKNAGKRAVKVIKGVEFAFRWCPPGTFMMGSPVSERGRDTDEKQHQVTLTKGFWMLETEVTQKQWKAVMENNPSSFKGDDLPVEKVSWNDCKDFCKKCTKLGLPVKLPTEAQWEYACRAGTTGAYSGNLDEMAWYDSNSNSKTHPVGTKKPNAWGLYDMHGNVWEWCQDWKADYPSGNVTDPIGPSNGSACVIRGGSWGINATSCRSAFRRHFIPGDWYISHGFRVVRGQ